MRWIIDYFIYRTVRNGLVDRRPPAPVQESAVGWILGGLFVTVIFGLLATPFLMFAASLWLGIPLLVGAVVGLIAIATGISIAKQNHRIREGTRSGRR
jgi:hypothetical protein